jgi:hypothetical protein
MNAFAPPLTSEVAWIGILSELRTCLNKREQYYLAVVAVDGDDCHRLLDCGGCAVWPPGPSL